MALTDEIADLVIVLQNDAGLSALCPPEPAECRASTRPGKSTLPAPGQDARQGRPAGLEVGGRRGDRRRPTTAIPLASDDYALCVYDDGVLITSATADARRPLRQEALLEGQDDGLRLHGQAPDAHGHAEADARPGLEPTARRRSLPRGRAFPLLMPDLSTITGPVDVQLHRSGGGPCFGSTFSAPFAKSDAHDLQGHGRLTEAPEFGHIGGAGT